MDRQVEGVAAPADATPSGRDARPEGAHVRRRRHWRWRWRGTRWQRVTTSNVFLGVVLAVLAWPTSTSRLQVVNGVGTAWQAALTMASHKHMAFGSRAIFTFGPLGFLVSPGFYFEWTAVLGFVFTLVFMAVLFGALVWSLRRTIALPLAIVVAYLVGGISIVSAKYFKDSVAVEEILALVLMVCVAALGRRQDDPVALWVWGVLGGVLSLFSLVKVSLGVGIAAALVITVACLPGDRRRVVGAIVLGAVPVFAVAWFGTGNGLGNIGAYVRSSVQVIGGYGAAMSTELPGRGYSYWLAGVAVVLVGVFALSHMRGLPRRAKIGVGLLTLSTTWFLFKEAFVRHDYHDLVFFVAVPLLLAAFSPKWHSPAGLVTAMLGVVLVVTSLAGAVPTQISQPVQSARDFGQVFGTLISSHKQATLISQSRDALSKYYKLPPQMLTLMRGKTVDVSPWEQTVIWSHPHVRFDPLPVLQDYSAYTPTLDQTDVRFLASAQAPQYILRQPTAALDGRNPTFEPPATQLAIECRYREVVADPSWQLLVRRPDRCGQPRLLQTVDTGLGHWVGVPAAPPGDAVVATFELPESPWTKLESLLFKPPSVSLSVNGARHNWRFIAATGPDFHVLRVPSTLGFAPYLAPPPTRTLRFSVQGASPNTSGIKIAFYEIPMRPF